MYGDGNFKFIIWTSYISELISQPPYSHEIDSASYDFTNNVEKMSLLVALLMDLLTTGGDG